MTKPILGGKPLKFETVESLQKVMQDYFDKTPSDEWTVTGLALCVGSKQLLNDYEARDEYKDIVREAKLLVENGYEIDLKKFGRAGSIFALKNFNWKDKMETDHTTGGQPINFAIPAEIAQKNNLINDNSISPSTEGNS